MVLDWSDSTLGAPVDGVSTRLEGADFWEKLDVGLVANWDLGSEVHGLEFFVSHGGEFVGGHVEGGGAGGELGVVGVDVGNIVGVDGGTAAVLSV